MPERKIIVDTILAAVDECNATLPVDRRIQTTEVTILVGDGARLDSLGLVNLIVAIEEQIQDRFGVGVSFADEMVASADVPFTTLGSLVDFVSELIDRQTSNERD